QQFTERTVGKSYLFATDRPMKQKSFTARSVLVRTGSKYTSRPIHAGGELAETEFKFLRVEGGRSFVEARPLTGRTHQIRVHAAEHRLAILGDELYGGTPAERLWLHAQELSLRHPETSESLNFYAAADFTPDWRFALRNSIVDPQKTNVYRLIHGASDR